ncbi:MAG: hypothetical protein GY928_25740 [Colwellia sp.]|nr:hypothetical protein [Colwellia sp.]
MADTIEEIHVADIGTALQITIKNGSAIVDLSSVTTKNLFLTKPSGAVLTKATTFVTDGTDGVIKYTTIAGDLDESGVWQMQVYIVGASGEWRTNVENLSVFSNLA